MMMMRMTQHYNINRKDEGTQDDLGRDGGTNCILRIKEQETCLTLQEHGDGDDKTSLTQLEASNIIPKELNSKVISNT